MSEHEEQADKLESPAANESMYTAQPFSRLKVFFFVLGAGFVLSVSAISLKVAYEGGADVIGESEPVKPPPTATEIIAAEFAGKIESAPADPKSLAEPPPGFIPSATEHESREIVEEPPSSPSSTMVEAATRKPAAVPSKLSLAVDKRSIKVTKNLDQKKISALIMKQLDKSCKIGDKAKSVKAEIKLSKTGTIANINVTPKSAEKELARCLRQKLADQKGLKPKTKSVAQITVQFKSK